MYAWETQLYIMRLRPNASCKDKVPVLPLISSMLDMLSQIVKIKLRTSEDK